MPVLASSLHECLAISVVLRGRIGLSFLAVAVDPIPFEVAKMGVYCLARCRGPLRTTETPFASLVIELDYPRLDGNATRAEAPVRIPLPTTLITITKE